MWLMGVFKKYKASFVARGFSHKEKINYGETFAQVARYASIQTIIALARYYYETSFYCLML
jgi:hypothetical protein